MSIYSTETFIAAYRLIGKHPVAACMLASGCLGIKVLWESNKTKQVALAKIDQDFKEYSDRDYVVLTGVIDSSSGYNTLCFNKRPGSLGIIYVKKVVTCSVKIFKSLSSYPQGQQSLPSTSEKVHNDEVRCYSKNYSIKLVSGETINIKSPENLEIDGESEAFTGSSEDVYESLIERAELSDFFRDGLAKNVKYSAWINYIPSGSEVSIIGELSISSEGSIFIEPPLDGKPYIITIKKIKDYIVANDNYQNLYASIGLTLLGAATFFYFRK